MNFLVVDRHRNIALSNHKAMPSCLTFRKTLTFQAVSDMPDFYMFGVHEELSIQ